MSSWNSSDSDRASSLDRRPTDRDCSCTRFARPLTMEEVFKEIDECLGLLVATFEFVQL